MTMDVESYEIPSYDLFCLTDGRTQRTDHSFKSSSSGLWHRVVLRKRC